ncbi:MAG: hypothetical protein CME33_08800 [Gimesia sp.]|jgi:hypothetical protein|nr:hypothetical protein [Gimesia sp.]|tara:strand:+ start:3207 stop:3452 length:246 start_codon:yes stop_codon:yes gene_type:complete
MSYEAAGLIQINDQRHRMGATFQMHYRPNRGKYFVRNMTRTGTFMFFIQRQLLLDSLSLIPPSTTETGCGNSFAVTGFVLN